MRSHSHNRKNESDRFRPREVYVNRLLDLRRIRAVGLDLDHTLAVYDDQAVNQLAFEETSSYLIDQRGYPPSLFHLDYQNYEIPRGVIADLERGVLLKLNALDRVCRAMRGTTPLGQSDIRSEYGDLPIALNGGRYDEFSSPFDLPAIHLFAKLVDTLQFCHSSPPDWRLVLTDIRVMLDRAHTRGDLKRHILEDPTRFLDRQTDLVPIIRRIRAAGKKTFLLTNSGYDYTSKILDYLFAPKIRPGGWHSLFDAAVVDADKPHFFREVECTPGDPDRTEIPRTTAVLSGGNAAALEQVLGAAGASVLYLGDNPAADIIAASQHGWRTAMVVPELEREPAFEGGAEPAGPVHDGGGGWGSVFWEKGSPTRFLRIIREYPDLWGANVQGVLGEEADHAYVP